MPCGKKNNDDKPDPDPAPDPQPTVITAEFTHGYVDMALDLPEGWSWEQVSDNGTDKTEGIRFYKTDDPTVSYTLLCWTGGYGICGTGVTSEEITLANGMKVWQHTEEGSDSLWLNLYFESVPGDYVCAPSGTLTKEMWDGCRVRHGLWPLQRGRRLLDGHLLQGRGGRKQQKLQDHASGQRNCGGIKRTAGRTQVRPVVRFLRFCRKRTGACCVYGPILPCLPL